MNAARPNMSVFIVGQLERFSESGTMHYFLVTSRADQLLESR